MTALLFDDRGSLALVTVLLLPLVLMLLVGAGELGFVRVVAERARIAADLAAVTAVNDQDDGELARTGLLRPAADAATVARAQLAANLAPLSGALAASPEAIAGSADVAVFREPGALDARTGRTYAGPTVRIAVEVPIGTPAFAALLARPVTVIRLFAASSAR